MYSGEGAGTGFATMRGRNYPAIRQFTVFLENKPGRLFNLCAALAKEKVNIEALTVMDIPAVYPPKDGVKETVRLLVFPVSAA